MQCCNRMRIIHANKMISRLSEVWWRNVPSGQQKGSTFGCGLDLKRFSTNSIEFRFLRNQPIGFLTTNMMSRSLATQQTKLEYSQDFHNNLGDIAVNIKAPQAVDTPSAGVPVTPDPLGGVEKGVEGGVLRQRGPRQKFRNSSTDADLPLPIQRTAKVDDSSRTVVSVTTQRLQRCVAYCTAESYSFDQLLQSLQKNRIPSLYFNEVIHVALPRAPSSIDEYDGQEGDVFYFKDGCVVFWDIPQPQVVALLTELALFEVSPYDRRTVFENYSEEMGFHYGKHAGLMPTGELVLSIGQQNWAKTQVSSPPRNARPLISQVARLLGRGGRREVGMLMLQEGIVSGDARVACMRRGWCCWRLIVSVGMRRGWCCWRQVLEKIAFSYGVQRSVKMSVRRDPHHHPHPLHVSALSPSLRPPPPSFSLAPFRSHLPLPLPSSQSSVASISTSARPSSR
jgi:hypothetical protein